MTQDLPHDTALWNAFRSGDKNAYAEIYELYFDSLYSYGKRFITDQTQVEDAIQELFITLWRTQERLSSVDNIKFYLFHSLRRDIRRINEKEKAVKKVDFEDTTAATLRYFYRIPASAKGKEVSFTFSAKATNGQTVSYKMGPYKIAEMDMVLDLVVKDNDAAYISIEDMAVYGPTAAAANAAKIDLVYLYRVIPNITFTHALVAPSAKDYLPGVTLPAGVNRSAKIRKVWALRDFHLARLQYGIYIDDVDFQQLDISNSPDYAINLRAESGAWVETADGKYRAYIYVNSIDNAGKSAKISIKRYTMK